MLVGFRDIRLFGHFHVAKADLEVFARFGNLVCLKGSHGRWLFLNLGGGDLLGRFETERAVELLTPPEFFLLLVQRLVENLVAVVAKWNPYIESG